MLKGTKERKMRIVYFLIICFFINSCNLKQGSKDVENNTENETNQSLNFVCSQYSNKEKISIDDLKKKKVDYNFKVDCPLDSIQLLNWTDNFVPYSSKDHKSRLYSANLYSVQPNINGIYPLIVYSNADHWNKLHLITIDKEKSLIDYELIGESQNWLLDQNDKGEIIGELIIEGKMINPTEYFKYKVFKKIHNYSRPDSSYIITDSIVTKIVIKESGKIKTEKIDSLRTINYAR